MFSPLDVKVEWEHLKFVFAIHLPIHTSSRINMQIEEAFKMFKEKANEGQNGFYNLV
jgi:hypothetical protein